MTSSINLTVNSVDRSLDNRKGSFSATDRINARTTFSFGLWGNYGSKPIIGEPVEIEFDNYYIAGSVHRNPQSRFARGVSDLAWDISCVDNHQLADKRVIAEVFVNMTDKAMVDYIIDNYLFEEGVTKGDIQESAEFEKVVFNYTKASNALNEISELTGFQWRINHDKSLDYFDRASNQAPWDVDDTQQIYDLQVEENREDYRNRQYIRAGQDVTDLQTRAFVGDGERQIFTLDYELAEKPTLYLKLDGEPDYTQVSLIDVGVRGLEEDKDWYYQIRDKQISRDDSLIPLGSNDRLKVEYIGYFPIIVVAEQSNEEISERASIENNSGIYESIVEKQEIDNRDAALEFAGAKLRRYGQINQVITYKTEKIGLRAGMLQQVQSGIHGINGYYLIESAGIRAIGDGKVEYSIKLISGESVGGWVQFFNDLLKGQRDFVIRENEVIVLLRNFQETIELDDELITEEIDYWVWQSDESKHMSDEVIINSDTAITQSDDSAGKILTLLFGGIKTYEVENNNGVNFSEVTH